MKADKLEELKIELTVITTILTRATDAFLIVEYLNKPEKDEKLFAQKKINFFFTYSQSIYWQTLIIELTKLLYFNERDKAKTSNREKFNILHFLKKLKKDGHFGSTKIPAVKIEQWSENLNKKESTILNIIMQRDKLYAHQDNQKVQNSASLKDIYELLNILQEIIREINHILLERGIDFNPVPSPVENLRDIIIKLVHPKSKY